MIFIDTWAWLALAYARDPYHKVAKKQHKLLQKAKRRYVTTDFVLSEFISSLFGVTPFATARQFVERLLQSCWQGHHLLVHVSPDQFRRAWEMRKNTRASRTFPLSISRRWW